MLPLPSLAEIYEHRAKLLAAAAVFFFAAWLRRGERVASLEATLAARPQINDARKASLDVKRGPVKIIRKTTVAPDGTKTTEQSREVAAEERHSAQESDHQEKPACPAAAPAPRYLAGFVIDPRSAVPALSIAPRVGITIGGRLDLAYSKTISGGLLDGHRADAAWRFGGR